MKTIIIDGDWNLKRNFLKRADVFARGEHCGGSFGFLESLRKVVNNILPDRTIVMWDGSAGGKLRHDIYPNYKSNRNKSFDEESYHLTPEQISEEDRKKYSILQQKIKIKNYLEELFVRQVECDCIEADDLIGKYVLDKSSDEEIIIFSADHDYYQLISETVSVLRPSDDVLITKKNFQKIFGFIQENILTLRCFEGDTSDCISGVDGIAFKTLVKHFPKFVEEEYTIDRFIEEAVDLYSNSKKKTKSLEKIIGCRKIFERNKKLMNLKAPFVNEQAINEVNDIRECIIVGHESFVDRSITNAMQMFIKDGYNTLVWNGDIELFFRPFYRLVSKEKEYAKKILEG